METAHSSLRWTTASDGLHFETWAGSNLPPDMYNVNIKWGNSTHFLSLLLHTLVTQSQQSYTIHLCRGKEKRKRKLPSVGMEKTNTKKWQESCESLENPRQGCISSLLLFIRHLLKSIQRTMHSEEVGENISLMWSARLCSSCLQLTRRWHSQAYLLHLNMAGCKTRHKGRWMYGKCEKNVNSVKWTHFSCWAFRQLSVQRIICQSWASAVSPSKNRRWKGHLLDEWADRDKWHQNHI